MFDDQSSQLIYSVKDLITFYNTDVTLIEPSLLILFAQRQIQSIFSIPTYILIVFYPDKLQIGNKVISYPFFIEGLERMVKQVLANLQDHRNATIQETQKSLFDS